MQIDGWTYYNHAMIPTSEPHETPNISPIESGDIWKAEGGIPLFARWTTNWDCGYETSFWACILDHAFSIEEIKAKRRYEINKGNRCFYTALADKDKVGEMYDVYVESLKGYAGQHAPIEKDKFIKHWIRSMGEPGASIIGAFDKETGRMCGFAHCINHGRYIPISSFKTMVSEEKNNVNFALMYGICEFYKEALTSGSYLFDGWRNMLHDTAFQDWLEKYFQFRKAYCALHMEYRPGLKPIIGVLFPFRNKLQKYRKIYSVLNMEECSRNAIEQRTND